MSLSMFRCPGCLYRYGATTCRRANRPDLSSWSGGNHGALNQTGHCQYIANDLADPNLLAIVPIQLEGTGWRHGDVQGVGTAVRGAIDFGTEHRIRADKISLNAASHRGTSLPRPRVANVVEAPHPPMAPTADQSGQPLHCSAFQDASMNLFHDQ